MGEKSLVVWYQTATVLLWALEGVQTVGHAACLPHTFVVPNAPIFPIHLMDHKTTPVASPAPLWHHRGRLTGDPNPSSPCGTASKGAFPERKKHSQSRYKCQCQDTNGDPQIPPERTKSAYGPDLTATTNVAWPMMHSCLWAWAPMQQSRQCSSPRTAGTQEHGCPSTRAALCWER